MDPGGLRGGYIPLIIIQELIILGATWWWASNTIKQLVSFYFEGYFIILKGKVATCTRDIWTT